MLITDDYEITRIDRRIDSHVSMTSGVATKTNMAEGKYKISKIDKFCVEFKLLVI